MVKQVDGEWQRTGHGLEYEYETIESQKLTHILPTVLR